MLLTVRIMELRRIKRNDDEAAIQPSPGLWHHEPGPVAKSTGKIVAVHLIVQRILELIPDMNDQGQIDHMLEEAD